MKITHLVLLMASLASCNKCLVQSDITPELRDDPKPYFGWSFCPGYDDTYIHLNTIDFSAIPTSGKPLTLTLEGHATQSVYVPYMHTKVKYGIITMYDGDQTVDMQFNQGQNMTHSQAVPAELAPPGKYNGQITAFNNAGTAIVCWDFWFIMARPSAQE